MIQSYFYYLNQISVIFLLGAFLVLWVRNYYFSEYEIDLESLIGSALASATVPTGAALIICAFDSSLVPLLKDLHLHLSVAGASLLFVAIRAIRKMW